MQFKYKAIKDDKVVVKKIEAENKQQVINFLKENNYIPIDVSGSNNILSNFSSQGSHFFGKLGRKDIIDFTRQLAIMVNAGLTLANALKILEKQTKKQGLVKLIKILDEQIREGNPFSHALKLFPKYFSNLYVALVRAGEASGKLNEILLNLADTMEKQNEMKGKLKSSMIYPVVILLSMVGVMSVILTVVVPKLVNIYSDFGIKLPTSTQVLVLVSDILTHYWILIIGAILGSIVLFKRYYASKKGREVIDGLMFKIPALSTTLKQVALIDNTRALALMVGAGVPILEGLSIIIETTDNVIFQKAYQNALKSVERGMSLGDAFAAEVVFPPILVQMTIVGENTGNLDQTLLRLSHYFEVESEIAIKGLTTLIEPATLIFLGLGVGLLVVSIITPIYSLTNSFNQ